MFASTFDFGIGQLPIADDADKVYIPYHCGNIFGIPKGCKNPKGGWMFAKYWVTDAAYATAVSYYNTTPKLSIVHYITHIPTRERLYNDFKDTFSEESWELIRIRDELIQKGNFPRYDLAEQTKFRMYYEKEFEKVMNNEISPKEFLVNAQAYGEALLKEFKERKIGEGWTFNEDGSVYPPDEK